MKIAISSGHGLFVRGAAGSPIPPQLDEVDTARWIVDRVALYLKHAGDTVHVIHDNVSQSQSDNLDWLVDAHNKTERDYDISVHMNCYNGQANGCEVLYTTGEGRELAQELVDGICAVGGFVNRGPKERNDLAWLNGTDEVACLIEVAFCDHTGDCQKVTTRGDAICRAIAEVLSNRSIIDAPPTEPPEWPEDRPPKPDYLFYARGRCSTFGGPDDQGVSASEGLAFIYEGDEEEFAHLLLPEQPPNTSGLARRLDPNVMYVACRWDYDTTSKDMLRNQSLKAGVRNTRTGRAIAAYPADWGPHEQETGRAADLSPALAEALGVETDDEVEVGYPLT
jgi:N-acetylmuramoyl-L-alanine amidase